MMMQGARNKSDMYGWTDGVAYTDLEIVENSYVRTADGVITNYNGWNRTGYVPCNGCSSITFPPMPQGDTPKSNRFYDINKNPISGAGITLSQSASVNIAVPANAYYFIISSNKTALPICINAGIVPHA